MPDNRGLYKKYEVYDADTQEMVEECFVLEPEDDYAAQEALWTYAQYTNNEKLQEDIFGWLADLGFEEVPDDA